MAIFKRLALVALVEGVFCDEYFGDAPYIRLPKGFYFLPNVF